MKKPSVFLTTQADRLNASVKQMVDRLGLDDQAVPSPAIIEHLAPAHASLQSAHMCEQLLGPAPEMVQAEVVKDIDVAIAFLDTYQPQ